MVDEYIRKQDAIDAATQDSTKNRTHSFRAGQARSASRIKALPSADVAPVRHGKWLPIVSYNNTYKCSECGRLLVDIADGLKMVAKHYPYCHCGAKMEEDNG